jgi:hypothetical protein
MDDMMRFDRRPIAFGSAPDMHFAARSTDPDMRLGIAGGWFMHSSAQVMMDRGVYIPAAEGAVRTDLAFKIAGSLEVWRGLFVGLSPTVATYRSISQGINIRNYESVSDTLNARLEKEQQRIFYPGFGWGLDAGLLYEILPTELRIGFAIRNMGLEMDGDGVPLAHDIGIAYLPGPFRNQGMLRYVNFALDYHQPFSSGPWWRKLAAGAEMNLRLAQIRVGLHEGYLTYGLGASLLVFQIEFVSFAQELGGYPGQIEDRHYLFGVRMGI